MSKDSIAPSTPLDLLLQSVHRLGVNASRMNIKDDTLLSAFELDEAISCACARSYLWVHEDGHYVVTPKIRPLVEARAADAARGKAKKTVAQPEAPVAVPEGMKVCGVHSRVIKGCGQTLPVSAFNKGQGVCKACLKAHADAHYKKPATKSATPVKPASGPIDKPIDEVIVPAEGSISLRKFHNQVVALRQGEDVLLASYGQLRVIVDWANKVLAEVSA